jgi:phosphate starvation-inducible protein PhoH and related proteins
MLAVCVIYDVCLWIQMFSIFGDYHTCGLLNTPGAQLSLRRLAILNRKLKRSNRANPREDRNMQKHKPKQMRNNIVELDQFQSNVKSRVELLPRNVSQEFFIEQLENPHQDIVFAVGPAGCGKTMLATLAAIQALQSGQVKKIVITRPAVSVDEQHGFLPGTLVDKMQPWVLPILDYFYEYYTRKQVLALIESGVIEIAPLAFMRGRTFRNSWILGDEFQNSTPNQMKMLLTRIGEGSKIVVTGDLNQHDRGFEANGLKDVIHRAQNMKGMVVCEFRRQDVERHPIIESVLDMYQD